MKSILNFTNLLCKLTVLTSPTEKLVAHARVQQGSMFPLRHQRWEKVNTILLTSYMCVFSFGSLVTALGEMS